MGDVLPPKRQTVVNRLKKRFDLYRNHHNACLPRYEQTSNGLYETQRQETLLLKQRFLESKTKKSKNHKSDHHRSSCKESSIDGPKTQPHPKPVKRHHEEPPPASSTDCPLKDSEKPAKAARTEKPPSEKTPDHLHHQQPAQPPPPLPNFSSQQFGRASPAQLPAQKAITAVQAISSELGPTANGPTSNKEPRSSLSESQSDSQPFPGTIPINGGTDVECKQEKDGAPDLHPCVSQGSNAGGGGDRLSDTFPSLGFAEDSGDDVIHPDLLKDLIEDVFTNSADIMKDFNFEDSVGSIKDPEDPAKDIIELVKGSSASPGEDLRSSFQTDGLTFANSQVSQQNGLFESAPQNSVSSVPTVTTTSTPTTSVTSFYSQPQRLPSYGSGGPLASGLGLDFKLTEPSPAALTLKQMAEQHQNMQQKQQQQQIVTSPLSNRPPFSQDVFANHINTLRPHFHSGSSIANSANLTQSAGDQTPMMPNNPANQYNAYNPMDSYPGVKPISPNLNSNSNVRLFKQEESVTPTELTIISEDNLSSKHQKLTKPPAYGATRPLTHYSDSAMHHHHHHHHLQQRHLHHHHQQQHHPMSQLGPSNQFLASAEQQPSFQMSQSQQMHASQQIHPSPANPDLKQQSSMIQPSHHLYGSYAQQNNDAGLLQHVSIPHSIHYTPQHFQTNAAIGNNRPPPEYRAHHPSTVSNDNLQMQAYKTSAKYMRNQLRPTSVVSMSSDGLTRTAAGGDWRQGVVNSQQSLNRIQAYPPQENFVGDLPRNIQHQQFFPHQYQMNMNMMSGGPPNVAADHGMMQQRQHRLPIQLRPRSEVGSPDVMGQMYSNHQTDISRHQDGSQISLDFLDNIESSASDLLNFDQVMQGNATHFPLLDDIEILGK